VSLKPVTQLSGVGPAVAAKLARLGIHAVQDLLFHLPYRYEDRTRLWPIGSVRLGAAVVIEGEIELSDIVYRRRRMLLCRVSDGSGAILLRFFHFNRQQQECLSRGTRIRCFGAIRSGPAGLEMVHPEYRVCKEGDTAGIEESLTPIYPVTEGIRQPRMRRLLRQALAIMAQSSHLLEEYLPEELVDSLDFPSLQDAVRYVHQPPPDAAQDLLVQGMHPAQRRLALEEVLAHTLSLKRLRQQSRRELALPLQSRGDSIRAFLNRFPFELTQAQQRVYQEIMRDLAQPVPMLRLVQGDVGSGKTVVAALAMLSAVESNYQTVLMAPTELLADQHYRNLKSWFEPLKVPVALLSGSLKTAARTRTLEGIACGTIPVVVGTHALYQEGVQFDELALIVVDEQHRFGVHQRLSLREKGRKGDRVPHQLVMTATPIPRTLAMTAYADLDVSVIDELPPGRTPVKTVVLPEARREEVVIRIRDACQLNRQAYWVCPLIDESDQLDAQAVNETASWLHAALPGLEIGLVHGRMKQNEKDRIMERFKQGQLDLLVATTVIEVGVDVPNASLMIIENAERLGLAQLHQLRGRVGRGEQQSSCVLLYRSPLSDLARERLSVLRNSNDGFVIAQRDLELRGPGEVLGTRQTGLMQFRIADLIRDRDLLPTMQILCNRLLNDYPEASDALIRRWVNQGDDFATV